MVGHTACSQGLARWSVHSGGWGERHHCMDFCSVPHKMANFVMRMLKYWAPRPVGDAEVDTDC